MHRPVTVRTLSRMALVLALTTCSKDRPAEHASAKPEVSAAAPTVAASEPAPAGQCTTFSEPTQVGRVQSSDLTEISGLSASHALPGVFYVHNDSGDSARFFALDDKGRTLAEFALEGASFSDCEDMALGTVAGKTFVYLGDIGDNPARDHRGTPRQSVQLYRVAEPEVAIDQGFERRPIRDWVKLDLVYPDRPHDTETLMFDAKTSDLIVITKEDDGKSSVFRVSASSFGGPRVTLEKIAALEFGGGTLPGVAWATGGDISATGDRIGIRTYSSIWLFERPPGESIAQALGRPPRSLPAPIEKQGEALGFSANGTCYFTASEGNEPALYKACEACR